MEEQKVFQYKDLGLISNKSCLIFVQKAFFVITSKLSKIKVSFSLGKGGKDDKKKKEAKAPQPKKEEKKPEKKKEEPAADDGLSSKYLITGPCSFIICEASLQSGCVVSFPQRFGFVLH